MKNLVHHLQFVAIHWNFLFLMNSNALQQTVISTKLHCAPPKWTLVQNHIVNLDLYVHCELLGYYILCPFPCAPLLKNVGTPCAPWCTMQVGGVQLRSMVHNIALYHWSGAQHSFVPLKWCTRRFHKPSQTDGQTAANKCTTSLLHCLNNKQLLCLPSIITEVTICLLLHVSPRFLWTGSVNISWLIRSCILVSVTILLPMAVVIFCFHSSWT